MRPPVPNPLLALAALVLLSASLHADTSITGMPLGSVIKGFVMPQRDAAGVLQANITGDQATIVSLNRTQILGLKVELYENDKVATTITSPRCDYWTLERRLNSHDGVLLVRPEARISADAIDWDFKTETAVLHRNVRVVLPQFTVGAPATPPPATPAPAS